MPNPFVRFIRLSSELPGSTLATLTPAPVFFEKNPDSAPSMLDPLLNRPEMPFCTIFRVMSVSIVCARLCRSSLPVVTNFVTASSMLLVALSDVRRGGPSSTG